MEILGKIEAKRTLSGTTVASVADSTQRLCGFRSLVTRKRCQFLPINSAVMSSHMIMGLRRVSLQ